MDPSASYTWNNSSYLFPIPYEDSPGTYSGESNQTDIDSLLEERESYRYLLEIDDNLFNNLRQSALTELSIGKSIFQLAGAMKLANLDALFGLTKRPISYIEAKSINRPAFCDLGAGPGGFTEYLQWRFPLSMVLGVTLNTPNNGWNMNAITPSRCIRFTNNTDSGDLLQNWKAFINFAREQFVDGIPLVLADISTDTSREEVIFGNENNTYPLLLVQSIVALEVIAAGGNLVLRLSDLNTSETQRIVYLLAKSFVKIYLIRPLTSSPEASECYLIGIGTLIDRNDSLNLLRQEEFLEITLPDSFIQWYEEQYAQLLEGQIFSLRRISQQYSGQEVEKIKLDPYLVNVVWNVPGNLA